MVSHCRFSGDLLDLSSILGNGACLVSDMGFYKLEQVLGLDSGGQGTVMGLLFYDLHCCQVLFCLVIG